MISFHRQQVALPLSQLSNAFHSLRSLVSSAVTSPKHSSAATSSLLRRLQTHCPTEQEPSLPAASVSPGELGLSGLGLSELGSAQLEELVGRLTLTLRAKEPLHTSLAWLATHISADSFFQNKHGFLLGTPALFGSPTFYRQYRSLPSGICSPVQIQHRGLKTRSPTLEQLMKQKNVPESQQDSFKAGFVEGFLVSRDLGRTQNRTFFGLLLLALLCYGVYRLGPPKILVDDEVPTPQIPRVTFNHVQGVDEAKSELQDIVEYLRNPDKFTALGGKLPKGVLLVGPPGTGKTLLARAVAGEAGVPFHYVSGSEFEEIYTGVGASRIRKLFKDAKTQTPCVVFIDELDAVGGKRVDSPLEPASARQTINQLLAEMDGFIPNQGVVVIGATNMAELLDKALVRPGRFDVQVSVPIPDVRGRTDILRWYLSKVMADPAVDARVIARGTAGFSGASLENLVNQAALRAAATDKTAVTMADLEFAKDKILMGPERRSAHIGLQDRTIVAYHEAGHAIVALYTRDATPVYKASILPRGATLGHVTLLPDDDRWHMTRAQLLADMDVDMGGRAAEELVFGGERVTTGASSDFDGATATAQMMVTRAGMSNELGVMTYANPTRQSPERQAAIEREVSALLEESYSRAKALLCEHSGEHRKLAEALLVHETLDAKQIRSLLKGTS